MEAIRATGSEREKHLIDTYKRDTDELIAKQKGEVDELTSALSVMTQQLSAISSQSDGDKGDTHMSYFIDFMVMYFFVHFYAYLYQY